MHLQNARAARIALLLPLALPLGCGSNGDAPVPTRDGGAPNSAPQADASTTDASTGTSDATMPSMSSDSGAAPDASASSPDASGGAPDASNGDVTVPDSAPPPPAPFDITFYVMADSHADPAPDNPDDLYAQALAINAVAQTGTWPTTIDGTATNFIGGPIGPPLGVVICGDLTGWGTAPTEIPNFQTYFEQGTTSYSINYPAYVGLGNHDIDTADRDDATANAYRATYWQYIASRYQGPQAPVPVTNFDSASEDYSWDWGGVHLIMTHRFAGDSEYGHPSGLPWLAADLQQYASDGRPVFLFHHYGMDAFGTDGQWWTPDDRLNYRTLLTGYHVAADVVGHTHVAFSYSWDGLNVQQINNAKAEINTGNNDGDGSFAIIRVTEKQFDMVTCRWTDHQGGYELISPSYSGPSDPGPAPPTTLKPEGEFASTCTNITLQGNSVLSATCQTSSGTQQTTLDLDSCITNANGGMWWSTPGNFSSSCSGCTLSGTELTCNCSNVSAQSAATSIDVNTEVTNCSGTLTCGPC